MIVLMLLGVAMGWPRFANTVSGWHKGVAWGLLPLLVLSPLTGLFLAWGISFTSPPPAGPRGAPVSMVDAVRKVGEAHDLSNLVWIRGRGGRLLARSSRAASSASMPSATGPDRHLPQLGAALPRGQFRRNLVGADECRHFDRRWSA